MAYTAAPHPVCASAVMAEFPAMAASLAAEFPDGWSASLHDSIERLGDHFSPSDPDSAGSRRATRKNLMRDAVARSRHVLADPVHHTGSRRC